MRKSKEADAAYKKAWYERKKTDPEWVEAQRKAEAEPRRREYAKAKSAAWRKANPERFRATMKTLYEAGYFARKKAEYRAKDPEGYRLRERNARVKSLFKIDGTRYRQMLAEQDNRCAICGLAEWRLIRGVVAELSVDHDRKCCPGKKSCGQCVRRLLCGRCNLTLGAVQDSPALLRAMADYLES